MKIFFRTALAILTMAWAVGADAQNYSDVLRYSQRYLQGTARSAGAGNAFGALGADFTATNINPAGLAVYRRPELSITGNFNHEKAEAKFYGSTANDDKYNFNFGNIGLVIADVKTQLGEPVTEGWVSVNFSMGFNRTNNYHSNILLNGTTSNTVLQALKDDADGYSPNVLFGDYYTLGGLGYNTYLLDSPGANNNYLMANRNEPADKFKVAQRDQISATGSANDISFSVAGNYSNKLYVGGSLVIPTVGYHYSRVFREKNVSERINDYESATLYDSLSTSGVGISARFGFIYKFSEQFRGGASIQLPTFYSLSDEYSYAASSSFTEFNRLASNSYFYVSSGPSIYKYKITTPPRYTFSGAWLVNKAGFISLDYELTDYRAGKLNAKFEGAIDRNQQIQDYLTMAHNIRIGGEYRLQNLALRLGYQLFTSPYSKELVPSKFGGGADVISFGAGYRDNDIYMDVAYMVQVTKSIYQPYATYSAGNAPEPAYITQSRGNFMFTIGNRF